MLNLVVEKQLPLFKIKKYKGYGYDISIIIEDDRIEINATPSIDILLQPEVDFGYIDGQLRAILSFNKTSITDLNLSEFKNNLNDTEKMIQEVNELLTILKNRA